MLYLGAVRIAEHSNPNGKFLGINGSVLDTVLHIGLAGVTDSAAHPSRRNGESMREHWLSIVGQDEACVTVQALPWAYYARYTPKPEQRTRMLRAGAVSTWLIAAAMERDTAELGGPLRQDVEVVTLSDGRELLAGYTPGAPFAVEAQGEVYEGVPLGELGAGGLHLALRAQLVYPELTGFCINQGEIWPWPASWLELTPHLPPGIE
jgi:hypothetical protein